MTSKDFFSELKKHILNEIKKVNSIQERYNPFKIEFKIGKEKYFSFLPNIPICHFYINFLQLGMPTVSDNPYQYKENIKNYLQDCYKNNKSLIISVVNTSFVRNDRTKNFSTFGDFEIQIAKDDINTNNLNFCKKVFDNLIS